CATSVYAQTWKWAKTVQASNGILLNNNQSVGTRWGADLTTDPAGNIYFLTQGGTQFQVDGHTFAGYGGNDVVINSFTCDGAYRWSKVIATTSDSDEAY